VSSTASADQSASTVHVALAADDNYARALTVAARSVIENLGRGRTLTIHVVDGGITPENRAKVEASLTRTNVALDWIGDVENKLRDLPTYGWFTPLTYARLLLPDLIPPSVDKVIYLDCDILVRHDIGELYDKEFGGNAALGVPDTGAAFVSCPWGLALWYDNGRRADEFNFNAGMLVVNLDYWRRERVGQQALDYIRSERYHYNVDQEAINAVVGSAIGAVEPRWNQQGELYDDKCALALPYPAATVQELRDDPWIIHFSNVDKPWHRDSKHPFTPEWIHYLDLTEFGGWRPPPLRRGVRVARFLIEAGRRTGRRAGWI